MAGDIEPAGYETPIRGAAVSPIIKMGIPRNFIPVLFMLASTFGLVLKFYPGLIIPVALYFFARWQTGKDPYWFDIYIEYLFGITKRWAATRGATGFKARYWAPR